jgi:predicted nucleotidyltransferase component of viral defense system
VKEHALAIARDAKNPTQKLNHLREYLQALILRSLYEMEAFASLSFVGGTALRFLYGLPRFSEDLDFCLESGATYAPEKWLAKLKRNLQFAGFDVSLSWNEKNIVHNGWVSITDLLQEAGLSLQATQKLSIKIEIDTRPPAGAILERRALNKYFLLALQHHDLSSLMAGKIHAICSRPYPKGRDWYDLLWYRTQMPPVLPNLTLLQHALDQTHPTPWQAGHWRNELISKLHTLDWKLVVKDVAPFLERPEDEAILTRAFVEKAIKESQPSGSGRC